MLDGPGDLIESHHLPSRPATPWIALLFGLPPGLLALFDPSKYYGFGIISAWFILAAIWLHRRAPRRVAVHENGLNVTFGRRRMRYYPWSQVTGVEVDTYDRGTAAWVQTVSITMAKGPSLQINLREGARLAEQIKARIPSNE